MRSASPLADTVRVVRENGSVVCWGQGTNGRLGQGDTSDSSVPVPVDNIANAISVSVGRDHACAVLATGIIQCWGKNNYGQVGNGATDDGHRPSMLELQTLWAVLPHLCTPGEHVSYAEMTIIADDRESRLSQMIVRAALSLSSSISMTWSH